MRNITFRKHHRWFGLTMSFFLLAFCLSGLLLNHRHLISDINVSRKWLPARYEFRHWNGGLLRSTLRLDDGRILAYGCNGIFLTDSAASSVADFNEGIPTGADFRQIRSVVATRFSSSEGYADRRALFAASPFALYRYGLHGCWHTVDMKLADGEKLTDLAARGDTLVVVSRSHIYTSLPPYRTFRRVDLAPPADYEATATAFRTVWLLHSGELFGEAGVIAVDIIAVILIVVSLSGVLFWAAKKTRPSKSRMKLKARTMKTALAWHDRTGRTTIAATLFICITGWCLRPPAMIPLALSRIPTLPGTTLRNSNAWHDKLRMLRYDSTCGDWLVSTSEGFYTLGADLARAVPQRLKSQPPVSVMGLNVWQPAEGGRWLCGSFSGMYVWDRRQGTSTDYFTGTPAPAKAGPPFGKKAIAGFSGDFADNKGRKQQVVAEYYDGTPLIRQPEWMNRLPMSLWNAALEVHSGRMFIGDIATYVFVFVMGLAAVWSLWTGYRIRRKKR